MRGSRWGAGAVVGAVVTFAVSLLLAACTALAQCPGGVCPSGVYRGGPLPGGNCPGGVCPRPDVRKPATPPVIHVPATNTPTPAWRIEAATGHRKAVVRVKTVDRNGQNSIGSGVIVRWGKRIVVLTARHVLKDAAKVSVGVRSGRWYEAKVLKVDVTWDVAVLDMGAPPEAEPADLEFGETAMLKRDDRLESCGYGPDGTLAVNQGRFLQYKAASGASAADWLVLSGHARGGDSGGPIFNEQGHVVGVLWGTDGQEVVGSQAGRLHRVLEAACGPLPTAQPQPMVATAIMPVTANEPVASEVAETAAGPAPSRCLPILRRPEPQPTPPPQVIVQADVEARSALQRIDGKLDLIVRQATAPPPLPTPEAKPASPLWFGLVAIGAVVLGSVIYFASQKG